MMKILASGWERTFTRRLPMVMASFSRNAATPLRKFHRDIEARDRQVGSSIAGLHMLENQVSAYESILKDLSNAMKEQINATQRDINREFTPVIEQAMVRFQIISHAGLKSLVVGRIGSPWSSDNVLLYYSTSSAWLTPKIGHCI